jgi:hypothetical protein
MIGCTARTLKVAVLVCGPMSFRPDVVKDERRGRTTPRPLQSYCEASHEGTVWLTRPPQPADDDSTKARQRRRVTWRLVGVGLFALVLLGVVLLTCIVWIPTWLYPSLSQTDLQNVSDVAKVQELEAARLKLQNDARTTLLQGLGALLVLTGRPSARA